VTREEERGREAAPSRGGFSYWVSDEQLRAFGKMTLLQRLEWVESARLFTLLARTPETAERQERLRRGEGFHAHR
jgi:hypothetical protein